MIRRRAKPQIGMPQHLRLCFFSLKSIVSPVTGEGWPIARFELAKGEGQRDAGRSLVGVGVERPGGGNEARMCDIDPERGRALAATVSIYETRYEDCKTYKIGLSPSHHLDQAHLAFLVY